jgi:pyocin large subunit-like protein
MAFAGFRMLFFAIVVGEEMMKIRETISVWILCTILCLSALACRATVQQTTASVAATDSPPAQTVKVRTEIGFRSRRNLEEHYQKHGREFGSISQAEYLQQAQTLRDRATGSDILEAGRADGVTTRFDRQAGTFLAFNADLTIRTFFKPNDGERYFKRQQNRER